MIGPKIKPTTEALVTTFNSAMANTFQTGPFKMEVPQSTVQVLKPLSYEFRVAEYVTESGEVKKVGLQVKVYSHYHSGGGHAVMEQDWTDVERVRLEA